MWYNVDVRKLAVLLLPTFLRGAVMQAYLRAMVKPIDDIHYQFLQKRKENLYIMEHNGQKCYLRAALNDSFDNELRRIEIDDGNLYDAEYIYTDAEIDSNPFLAKYLDLILYQDADLGDTAVDFYVRVPTDIFYNEYEMKYLIDFYKLASKRYLIVPL
ncbi:hypothetical protein [Epilithonimonas mollis]|uniref:Uncharacterized protein n=1 Tax=Epilithonimonas mollis TaxID=216903 RepID=A0A1M6UL76_9FLAO|nr:hypothetical protein [Epilithonimonas mollis]SHK69919.1 hypothetical protein SAMN05444371_3364 [Epilithonimonas mollis]